LEAAIYHYPYFCTPFTDLPCVHVTAHFWPSDYPSTALVSTCPWMPLDFSHMPTKVGRKETGRKKAFLMAPTYSLHLRITTPPLLAPSPSLWCPQRRRSLPLAPLLRHPQRRPSSSPASLLRPLRRCPCRCSTSPDRLLDGTLIGSLLDL
jgi:hypothetical protein